MFTWAPARPFFASASVLPGSSSATSRLGVYASMSDSPSNALLSSSCRSTHARIRVRLWLPRRHHIRATAWPRAGTSGCHQVAHRTPGRTGWEWREPRPVGHPPHSLDLATDLPKGVARNDDVTGLVRDKDLATTSKVYHGPVGLGDVELYGLRGTAWPHEANEVAPTDPGGKVRPEGLLVPRGCHQQGH